MTWDNDIPTRSNRDDWLLGLLLVTLLCASCTRSKGPVCDGPTTPPSVDEPCPSGTSVVPARCPFESCRYCEKPDRKAMSDVGVSRAFQWTQE
jgi:hypothetical protein